MCIDLSGRRNGSSRPSNVPSPPRCQVRIQEQFRAPEMRVDLVSVQFALHYGFESLQQAERMLENVSDRLRPGGYFIATVPDGHAIM